MPDKKINAVGLNRGWEEGVYMWEESIRLELLSSGMARAIKNAGFMDGKGGGKNGSQGGPYVNAGAFSEIYRDLRIEFPTLSEREIWQVIGLCAKVFAKGREEH